ncbi:MAG: hypothetical protein Fur007_17710 [Rhodoferax sp.]
MAVTPSAQTFPTIPLTRRATCLWSLAMLTTGVGAQEELSDLARVRARGTLKVAVYKNNAPFSDGAADQMVGLDVDLAAALARQMQLKLALLPFDAGENMGDDLRNMVWKGHYLGYGPADVMLNVPVDKYLAQENRQVVIFAPYMRQVPVLLHRLDRLPDVQSPKDLLGHPLAAERGTGAAGVLMGQDNRALSGQVKLYDSGVAAAQAVLDGTAHAAYVLRSQAEAALAQRKAGMADFRLTPLQLPGLPANGWPIGLAVKTSNKALGEALKEAMQALRDSGELLAIFQRHDMTLTAP